MSVLVKACNIAPTSEAATRASSWKQSGTKGAGNFAAVMEEVVGFIASSLGITATYTTPCTRSGSPTHAGMRKASRQWKHRKVAFKPVRQQAGTGPHN